jgi:hypothetical protein
VNIGREIDTRTLTPAKVEPAKPGIPERAKPARPARTVEDPSKAPVKTPSRK